LPFESVRRKGKDKQKHIKKQYGERESRKETAIRPMQPRASADQIGVANMMQKTGRCRRPWTWHVQKETA
jgi:hypothetical protein